MIPIATSQGQEMKENKRRKKHQNGKVKEEAYKREGQYLAA